MYDQGDPADDSISNIHDYEGLRKFIMSKGYDGVVYFNEIERDDSDSYIVFNNSQIKILRQVENIPLEKISPKYAKMWTKSNFKDLKEYLSDDEFAKLSDEEKLQWIKIHISDEDHPDVRHIRDARFAMLSRKLKLAYMYAGAGLSEKQYASIQNDKDLIQHYVRATYKHIEKLIEYDWTLQYLNTTQLDILMKNKDLLDQMSEEQIKEFRTLTGQDEE